MSSVFVLAIAAVSAIAVLAFTYLLFSRCSSRLADMGKIVTTTYRTMATGYARLDNQRLILAASLYDYLERNNRLCFIDEWLATRFSHEVPSTRGRDSPLGLYELDLQHLIELVTAVIELFEQENIREQYTLAKTMRRDYFDARADYARASESLAFQCSRPQYAILTWLHPHLLPDKPYFPYSAGIESLTARDDKTELPEPEDSTRDD